MNTLEMALQQGFADTSFAITKGVDHQTKKDLYFVSWIDGPHIDDIDHYCSTNEYVLKCRRYLSSKVANRLARKINGDFKETVVEVRLFPLEMTVNTEGAQSKDGFILFPRIEMRANADMVLEAIESEIMSLS